MQETLKENQCSMQATLQDQLTSIQRQLASIQKGKHAPQDETKEDSKTTLEYIKSDVQVGQEESRIVATDLTPQSNANMLF